MQLSICSSSFPLRLASEQIIPVMPGICLLAGKTYRGSGLFGCSICPGRLGFHCSQPPFEREHEFPKKCRPRGDHRRNEIVWQQILQTMVQAESKRQTSPCGQRNIISGQENLVKTIAMLE